MSTIAQLIEEAVADGFDVTITIRRRDDGKEGVLKMPIPWARRMGLDVDALKNSET